MGNAKERRRRGNRNGAKGGKENDGKISSHQQLRTSNDNATNQSTPVQKSEATPPNNLSYKLHSALLVQLTEEVPTWYDCGRNTTGRDGTIFDEDNNSSNNKNSNNSEKNQQQPIRKNTREMISKYRQFADEVYGHEVALSRQNSEAGRGPYSERDAKWVENTMRRGTLKDRVAAMSVVVGTDPVHKLYALDMLLDLAGCGVGPDAGAVPNSRVGQMASEALSDLFSSVLLPKDRKLVYLEERPLHLYEGDRTLSPRVLLLWRYEDMVKRRYASYLSRYLGRTLAGEDESAKKSALATSSALLIRIPEGEEVLLTMIVNKIGDPRRKIASAAGHQLRLILEEHPVMVNVVAREVQQLAHRPHLCPRALYNCVVFLNQLQLSHDDGNGPGEETKSDKTTQKPTSLPASLINTYFHLFEIIVRKDEAKKRGSPKTQSGSRDTSSAMKSRLLSALLTGVNRAHPYLPEKDAAMEQHIDALYLISHTAPPAAATQALMLLLQLAVGSGGSAEGGPASAAEKDDGTATARRDRFYRALYAKLADRGMFAGRQTTLFFNLLYKAMKHDTRPERAAAFARRLLHAALHLPSSVVCGSLFLLSEIVRCRPELRRGAGPAAPGAAPFDPTKREPCAAFSGAGPIESSWEVSLLTRHFHPSVARFAADSGGDILYRGDPLRDFALTPFLDKFAFRNPKSLDTLSRKLKRGESIAERKNGLGGRTAPPMNDRSYLGTKDVLEEDMFFHKFFLERARRDDIKGVIRGSGTGKDSDDSDIEDEAINASEADSMFDANLGGDTDSEEEVFVNQLAERLMETAGNGKADFDEDPDMDDWSDFDNDGDDDENEDVNLKNDQDNGDRAFVGKGGDEDAFMDADSSDDSEAENVLDAIERDEDNSDDDAALSSKLLGEAGSDDHEKNNKKGNKRKEAMSIYADSEEYTKILEDESKVLSQGHNHEPDSTMKKKKIPRKKKRLKKRH